MSDAGVVTVESGRGVYRASALGQCERALIAARMGMTPAAPPAWLQAKFDEGHKWEPVIMGALEQVHELRIVGQQETVEIPVGEFALIRGHIDGRAAPTHLVEAKALGKSLFDEWWSKGVRQFFDSHPGYRDQLTLYMSALGLPALYVVLDKERSTEQDPVLTVTEVAEPPGDLDEIKARVLQIELAGRKGALPKECIAPSFPCPFYYLPSHDAKEAKPDDTDEFAVLAQEAVEAREDKKRAEERAKSANAQLLEYLQQQGADKLECEGYTANRVASKSTSFDREAMKADGVLEQYLKEKQFEYAKAQRKEE